MNPTVIKYAPTLAGEMKRFCGSQCDEFNYRIYNQIMGILWRPNMSEKDITDLSHSVMSAMEGLAPRDEAEGMLVAQMVAAHQAGMECHRRAMLPNQSAEGTMQFLASANKISRTYASLLDTLQRYRGKGQQKVTVEHVHIHAGGQAIVGTIAQTPGGGDAEKTEEQPHAKQIEHQPPVYAPIQAMPRQNEKGLPVPVTGDVKREMPNARRRIHRRTEGQ